jgi:Uma2 family endonuclease
MIANVEPKKLTVAEYHQMEFSDDDTHLYELLDGDIVKRKAPAPRHQLILSELNDQVKAFVKANQLGRVIFSPIDVFLDEDNAPQPDLVFVAQHQLHIITENGVEGVPTLVVEIISPTSVYRDRVTKKALYERVGIQEYWLVDPADEYIEIFALREGRYDLLSAASTQEGTLHSEVLPGLVLDINTLFN